MPETAEARAEIAAPPAAVWALLGSFDNSWHPAVAACRVEGDFPSRQRIFTCHGISQTFVEQETALDGDAMRLAYAMEKGSDVLTSYIAEITCRARGPNTEVRWRATMDGANPEAVRESAAITREIFQAGLAEARRRLEITALRLEGGQALALLMAGKGDLALLLHGIGGTKENWRPQLHALAPYVNAVAFDLRGYHESAPLSGEMTLDAIFADIGRIMDHFGAGRLHLVGLSFGAWAAACYAHRHPERIISLTVSGGCTGMSEAGEEERARFLDLRLAALDRGETPASLAAGIFPRLAGPAADVRLRAAFQASMAAISPEAYRAALRCFADPPWRLDFARFRFPVLAMTGEFDRLATPGEIEGVAARMPNARFHCLKGLGHLCNMEGPDLYNAGLVPFIRAHPARPEDDRRELEIECARHDK